MDLRMAQCHDDRVPGISGTRLRDTIVSLIVFLSHIVPLKHVPKGHVSFLKFQKLSGTRIVLSPWNRVVSLNCVHGHVPDSTQYWCQKV